MAGECPKGIAFTVLGSPAELPRSTWDETSEPLPPWSRYQGGNGMCVLLAEIRRVKHWLLGAQSNVQWKPAFRDIARY